MATVAPQQISFNGRISVDNSNEMRQRISLALKLKPGELVVDLSGVTSIDISGLATLVESSRMARTQGTRLAISEFHGQVALLFQISRLDQILDTSAERQSA